MEPDRLTLAVDAMGGDTAPTMVVEGVNISSQKLSGVKYLLFGNEAEIQPLLDDYPSVRAVSSVRHADGIVLNDDKPAVSSSER